MTTDVDFKQNPPAREIAINEDAFFASLLFLSLSHSPSDKIKFDAYLCATIDGNSQNVRY